MIAGFYALREIRIKENSQKSQIAWGEGLDNLPRLASMAHWQWQWRTIGASHQENGRWQDFSIIVNNAIEKAFLAGEVALYVADGQAVHFIDLNKKIFKTIDDDDVEEENGPPQRRPQSIRCIFAAGSPKRKREEDAKPATTRHKGEDRPEPEKEKEPSSLQDREKGKEKNTLDKVSQVLKFGGAQWIPQSSEEEVRNPCPSALAGYVSNSILSDRLC